MDKPTYEEIVEFAKNARNNLPKVEGWETWNNYPTGYSDALYEVLEFMGVKVVLIV